MTWLGELARFGSGTILIAAGSLKLASRTSLQLTLAEFGIRPSIARFGSHILPLGEIIAGLFVVTGNALFAGLLTIGIGSAFAVAGLVTLLKGKRISCQCFGSETSSTLGVRQLAFFPAWVGAGLTIITVATPPGAQVDSVLARLCLVLIITTLALMPRLVRRTRHLYSFRKAIVP